MASVSFSMPYLYLIIAGCNIPAWVYVLILLMFVYGGYSIWKKVTIKPDASDNWSATFSCFMLVIFLPVNGRIAGYPNAMALEKISKKISCRNNIRFLTSLSYLLTMLYFLTFAAAAFFIAHVVFLFTSFHRSGFSNRRYFYAHLTLWLAGISVFLLAWRYQGRAISGFLDYFDTFSHLITILVFTAALSLVAHLIVKFLVLPLWQIR